MMSLVPMRLNRMGKDNQGPMFHRRYPQGMVRQGISAELIAARWGFDAMRWTSLRLASHRRALEAEDAGLTGRRDRSRRCAGAGGRDAPVEERDEGPRRDTSLEKAGGAEARLRGRGRPARFPEIRWSVTAGNSSQVTDGARRC